MTTPMASKSTAWVALFLFTFFVTCTHRHGIPRHTDGHAER
jgi:hypothetical protein